VTRWGAYVEQRLGELERGEGDYTGLQRPSAGAIMSAREVAASLFRDDTPTPSVVPTESGDVAFVWHKNGIDAELDVNETEADLWAHDRADGDMWSGAVADHRGCCVKRLLDRLAGESS
jgi:hypothetical protein